MTRYYVTARFVRLSTKGDRWPQTCTLGVEVEAEDGRLARDGAVIPHSSANWEEVPGKREVERVQTYPEVKAELAKYAARGLNPFTGWQDEDDEVPFETRGGVEFIVHGYFEAEGPGGDGWNEPRYDGQAWLGLACNPRTGQPCPRREYWTRHPANRDAVDHINQAATERYFDR